MKKIIRNSIRVYRGISRRLRKFLISLQLNNVGEGFLCDQKVIVYGGKNISVGSGTIFNRGVLLQSCEDAEILIGDNVTLSYDVKLITGNLEFKSKPNERKHNANSIIIGNDVWVGANSIILPGVCISNKNVIAAGSVVNKSIDTEGAIYAGVPAKFIKFI